MRRRAAAGASQMVGSAQTAIADANHAKSKPGGRKANLQRLSTSAHVPLGGDGRQRAPPGKSRTSGTNPPRVTAHAGQFPRSTPLARLSSWRRKQTPLHVSNEEPKFIVWENRQERKGQFSRASASTGSGLPPGEWLSARNHRPEDLRFRGRAIRTTSVRPSRLRLRSWP